ncbi:hypothetical protein V8E36_000831 [Tilletia maclaganii]
MDEFDLKALRETLVVSLSLLPPNAIVSLITFGTVTRLRVVRAQAGPGDARPHRRRRRRRRQRAPSRAPGAPGPSQPAAGAAGGRHLGAARFLLPVLQCEFELADILQ